MYTIFPTNNYYCNLSYSAISNTDFNNGLTLNELFFITLCDYTTQEKK